MVVPTLESRARRLHEGVLESKDVTNVPPATCYKYSGQIANQHSGHHATLKKNLLALAVLYDSQVDI